MAEEEDDDKCVWCVMGFRGELFVKKFGRRDAGKKKGGGGVCGEEVK